MRQLRFLTSVTFITLLIVLGFQNCGQPGAIAIEGASSPSTLSNSLEIGLPNSQVPAGNGIVPPATHVVAGGESVPAVTHPASTGGKVCRHEEDSDDDSDMDSDKDSDKDSDDDCDHENSINDEAFEAICRDVNASDIMLNVASVVGEDSLLTISGDPSISLAKASLTLQAVKSGDVKELKLLLKQDGNVLMGLKGEVYDLKTPSAQTSGLKVILASKTHVKAGQKYELKLNIDLSEQIVRAGKKCLIKPAIKAAVLKAI